MTLQEFSDEFDVLYNNITSNQAPGLDDYEKSVFLTKAQDELLKSYFDPRRNKVLEGIDGSEIRQIDFSKVIEVAHISTFNTALYDDKENSRSVVLPSNIMMVINEYLKVNRKGRNSLLRLSVIPIDYSAYTIFSSKPFKRPLHYQAWRIINTTTSSIADLIPGPSDQIIEYNIRYVKKPKPIILTDLDGVSIEGLNTAADCELDPAVHRELLQRAVELAKASYTGNLEHVIGLGSSSQTGVGTPAGGQQQNR